MTIAIPRLDRTTAADRGLTLADFLVPIPVGERLNARVRHIILIATGALFIYLTARFAIPRDPIPWTGQTFGILVVGGALGARRGFAAVALYVLLGLVGLPFFAEGKGGTAVLLGPSGGYLIGFLLAGTIVGRLAELGWDRRIGGAIAMMLIGSFIIYAVGLPWLSYSRHLTMADTIAAGLTPFIAWDAVKLLVAAGIFPVAWWLVGRRPDDR
jgi:biotin transport system substrate-specific component